MQVDDTGTCPVCCPLSKLICSQFVRDIKRQNRECIKIVRKVNPTAHILWEKCFKNFLWALKSVPLCFQILGGCSTLFCARSIYSSLINLHILYGPISKHNRRSVQIYIYDVQKTLPMRACGLYFEASGCSCTHTHTHTHPCTQASPYSDMSLHPIMLLSLWYVGCSMECFCMKI